MVPGSHLGKLYSMYDESGSFAVRIAPEEAGWIEEHVVDAPVGPPGTTVYSSADSFSYPPSPIPSPRLGEIVRGHPARFANFDVRPCELPPDWAREGYGGPWKRQRAAERAVPGR